MDIRTSSAEFWYPVSAITLPLTKLQRLSQRHSMQNLVSALGEVMRIAEEGDDQGVHGGLVLSRFDESMSGRNGSARTHERPRYLAGVLR